MKLHGVRPALAVAVFAAAILAACGGGGGGAVPGGGGGGGGGGGPTPTPVPTATPGPNFVKGVSGVAQIPANASNTFSSSMLGASNDGTFVIQSEDAPKRPPATFTLTEYNVTASESAAGVTSSTSKARVASAVGREGTNGVLPFRPHLDPRTSALQESFHGHSALSIARGVSVQSVRRTSSFPTGTTRTFHVQQGTITGLGGTCTPPQKPVGTSGCYLDVPTHLLSVSTHSYVWVDDAIDPSYGLTQSDWDLTGTTFDNDFTRETAAFAPAFIPGPTQSYQQCDSNGNPLPNPPNGYNPVPDLSGTDPHISILITKALENTGEGGYFDFYNNLNDQEVNCAFQGANHVPSNNLPMFVLGADKYGQNGTGADANYWRTQDMPRIRSARVSALSALAQQSDRVPISRARPGQFDDAFVDEGDSMLAEDFVLGSGANPPQSTDSLVN